MFSCVKGDYYRVSEIQLSYRSKINPSQRPQICGSEDSYAVFRRHWADDKLDFIEQAKLLLLNRASRGLGIYELSTGSTTGTIIDTRMVFAAALKANASSIVVAHNHPSGNLEPSSRDKLVTNQLREAGALMNIPMLDHIIVGRHGYYSFADDAECSLEQLPHMTTRGLSKLQNVVG